MFWGTWF